MPLRVSVLGPVDALSGRLQFTVRRHKFNTDCLSVGDIRRAAEGGGLREILRPRTGTPVEPSTLHLTHTLTHTHTLSHTHTHTHTHTLNRRKPKPFLLIPKS